MTGTTEPQSHPSTASHDLSLLVSLATIPFLVVLVGGQVMNRQLLDLSLASEELFRGDRLPLLPFPDPE